MRLQYLPSLCLFWAGTKGCLALVPSLRIATVAMNTRTAVGSRSSSGRSRRSESMPYALNSPKRECLRIRGGWGASRGLRRQSNLHSGVSSPQQSQEPEGPDADVRGGALARKARKSTAWLDPFHGPLEFQVIVFLLGAISRS